MSEDDFDALNPKKRGLGRGLNALFEDDEGVYPQADPDGHTPGRQRQMMGIDLLHRGESQPRRMFSEDSINELADSIRQHGILQPILVRPDKFDPDRYEIIAGERRWQAAQKAQLHEVPVLVMDISDLEAYEIALIENLQREDLDPVDEALAYKKLMDEHDYTQEKLAESLGKSRSHIANMVRLLQLPDDVQAHLGAGDISIGHARALITASNASALCKDIISKGLSVRDTEKLAAGEAGRTTKKASGPSPKKPAKDQDTIALEHEVSQSLGMRVSIDSPNGKSGKLAIEFRDLDQLDDLLQRLSQVPERSARLMG